MRLYGYADNLIIVNPKIVKVFWVHHNTVFQRDFFSVIAITQLDPGLVELRERIQVSVFVVAIHYIAIDS